MSIYTKKLVFFFFKGKRVNSLTSQLEHIKIGLFYCKQEV